MAYSCKVLLDSVSPANVRLTTFEVTIPRIVLAEWNTHRMLSRNSASSRAIPVEKMIAKVKEDPFIPLFWGKNQKGMQASVELTPEEQLVAVDQWLMARDQAVAFASHLAITLDVHKQIANRLLEPFLFHTIIFTATELENFFNLRDHRMAQPEICRPVQLVKQAYANSRPQLLKEGQWHLPLVTNIDEATLIAEGYTTDQLVRISCARCARVSYLTHEGKRDPQKDLSMCADLIKNGHMSPLEHAAQAQDTPVYWGNFRGWKQFRKTLPNEAIFPREDLA